VARLVSGAGRSRTESWVEKAQCEADASPEVVRDTHLLEEGLRLLGRTAQPFLLSGGDCAIDRGGPAQANDQLFQVLEHLHVTLDAFQRRPVTPIRDRTAKPWGEEPWLATTNDYERN